MRKQKLKENKGITLIALVITIIILLILAGITIGLVTGDNGLLAQATRAKEETEKAQLKEETTLGQYESYINKETNTVAVVGEIVTGGNKPYTNNGTAIIPEGFAIVPGLDNVEEGLVISDKANDIENKGNQFVWIPVPEFSEFKRYDFKNNKELPIDYTENSGDGITVDEMANEDEREAQEMYKSVKDNGGFYIGRYEAGNDGLGNAISKKYVNLYNNIPWESDETNGIIGAVEKARDFDTQSGHENVTSTLIYGVQWDAVMRWISKDDKLKGYLTDSSDIGNYSGTLNSITGENDNYKIKNIYDLAGNVWEMTMESYNIVYRVSRGGDFGNDGNPYPCSDRSIGTTSNKANFKRI